VFLGKRVVLDDGHGAVPAVGIELAGFEQLRPAEHRVQRRAQLVGQRRQEFILQAIDAFGLAPRTPFATQQRRTLGFRPAVPRNHGL
jgi:hypothetical protein